MRAKVTIVADLSQICHFHPRHHRDTQSLGRNKKNDARKKKAEEKGKLFTTQRNKKCCWCLHGRSFKTQSGGVVKEKRDQAAVLNRTKGRACVITLLHGFMQDGDRLGDLYDYS